MEGLKELIIKCTYVKAELEFGVLVFMRRKTDPRNKHLSPGMGGGGYSRHIRIGVCREGY